MKRIGIVFILFIFLFSLCGCDALVELENGVDRLTNAFKKDEQVYEYGECTLVLCDRADLLSENEEVELVSAIESYCKQVDCDVLIITTNAQAMSATSYSGAYISSFFPEGSEDNISFVIDANHGEWSMPKHGYVADLPDGHSYYAFDLADKAMGEDDDYCDGLKAMVIHMLKKIDDIEQH